MDNRKSTRNSTCTTSSCKGQCMVWVYCIIYHRAIFLRRKCLGLITVTVTDQRYEYLFCNHVIPALQQHGCVDQIIFIQDGAPPHIANAVKQLHFVLVRIVGLRSTVDFLDLGVKGDCPPWRTFFVTFRKS